MADTLDIALKATKAQPSGGGNGTALKARSNYGAAKDNLTHLHLWLSVDHGIELSWRGQADVVERLGRGVQQNGPGGRQTGAPGPFGGLGGSGAGQAPSGRFGFPLGRPPAGVMTHNPKQRRRK